MSGGDARRETILFVNSLRRSIPSSTSPAWDARRGYSGGRPLHRAGTVGLRNAQNHAETAQKVEGWLRGLRQEISGRIRGAIVILAAEIASTISADSCSVAIALSMAGRIPTTTISCGSPSPAAATCTGFGTCCPPAAPLAPTRAAASNHAPCAGEFTMRARRMLARSPTHVRIDVFKKHSLTINRYSRGPHYGLACSLVRSNR